MTNKAQVKVATAAYPLDWFADWREFEAKQRAWVAEAAEAGADLLVFPEYGAMELASLGGDNVAGDVQGSIRAVSERVDEMNALHGRLANEFGVHILGGSAPVEDGARVVNRAHLFAPSGAVGHQDKQIMTRFERDEWGVSGGGPLRVFDTPLGRIAILICYDSEFPLLARSLVEAGAEILLVPSCTEALEGYWRVRIGAMARALECQCVSVMASLVGDQPRIYAVEENTGLGGVFGPPDMGFPPTGVLAEGKLDAPGWTYAMIDRAAIEAVRADGHVLNMTHWTEQAERLPHIERITL
ncbi:carbon-nitrogen hydrolase family protein [Lutimaribacter sp. EGI FJ00015]|uniref:Carbon-nitrogen hydrolase family protein n=1 Tax=Lutimaribacter degradans TaxID=2945989 RepID=A0ACC5ZUF7_9RHOB|nr:carbon-nitrogen hydrolase family protein [Lutimaribacter sp. EGI FJ00013]MCM2561470.1 carbon-nitrogen hydrolase family protein [Lutimaribacter sp. EGI FJ00013]MCO0612819.1 carbon-nitrogen hydrolase family protein [Lutimaribacter sp. EGI FJ00015]MCO0635477.1 carbon-nitrogen hydrolase family protein [Lutimaribacter sp. EGI FJ00014]